MGRSRQDLIDELEAMLYMDLPPDDQLPVIPLKGRTFLHSMWNAGRIQLKQMRGVRKIQGYLDSNPGWFENITAKIRSAETGQALLRLFQTEIRPHILHGVWCVLGIATFSANYTIKLRRDLEKLVGLEDANILIANMSNGAETLMSLGPVVGLAKVTSGEMTREKFLEKVGHRGPDEFELSVPRPAEDPAWIDQQLNLFRQSPVDVSALLQKQQDRFARVWSRLEKEFPREARFIGKRIRESVRRARLREASRSAYVRDRWSLRLFALRAGELSGLGEDIFFLTLDEVLDLLAGNREMVRFIPARKQTYRQYQLLPPYPPLIQGNFDPFANNRASIAFEDAQTSPWIYGSPGSAGQVEGTARILTDPAEGGQLQPGEILVTYQTDISWTLLFPRAAAIVTDVGAPLTHAAIVARELGIPAVVGCGNATQRLKTGDRIRVNGGLGVVEILPA
jgi:rifampicin phosphotransferase